MNLLGKKEEMVMKKFIIVISAAVFALVACNKETPAVENEPEEATKLEFNIKVNHPGDTKAVKTGWENGDKIYVFFEDITPTNYVELVYNGSNWDATCQGELTPGMLAASGKYMSAVFFPYEQPVIAAGGSGVTFRTGNHNDEAIDGLHLYTYFMKSEKVEYTKTTVGSVATLNGTLYMTIPDGYVQFFIDKNGSKYNADYTYRLSVDGIKPAACSGYDSSTGLFTAKTDILAAQPMWGYKYGDVGVAFSGMIDTEVGANHLWNNSSNSHIVYLFDTEAAAKTTTISGVTLSSRASVNISGTKGGSIISWVPAAKEPDLVSRGGIQWGTFNLGATKAAVDSYGWYFQWGNIIPLCGTADKDIPLDYGTDENYKKTIFVDAYLKGKTGPYRWIDTVHDLVADGNNHWEIYDMVRAFLGSPWRLPTSDVSNSGNGEFAALLGPGPTKSEDFKWGTDNCALISNDDQIIFPAAGQWYDDRLEQVGVKGFYWSSTKEREQSYTHRFGIVKDPGSGKTPIVGPTGHDNQYRGMTVRPVQGASGTTGETLKAWE